AQSTHPANASQASRAAHRESGAATSGDIVRVLDLEVIGLALLRDQRMADAQLLHRERNDFIKHTVLAVSPRIRQRHNAKLEMTDERVVQVDRAIRFTIAVVEVVPHQLDHPAFATRRLVPARRATPGISAARAERPAGTG